MSEKGYLAQMKKRFYLLDAFRAVALINMILFHAAYDLVYIFDKEMPWFVSAPGYVWQQAICWSFIFLSGMCFSFSRNHKRRGLLIFAMAMILTVVTALFTPDMLIQFGILHFMGLAMLLVSLMEPLLGKIRPVFGFSGAVLLFILCRDINTGYLGFEGFHFAALPSALYESSLLFPVGFPSRSFYSSDYFSILPWLFLYCAGYFFWRIIKDAPAVQRVLCFKIPVVSLIGSKTLPIYMVHQPVILAVLTVCSHIMGW